MTTFPDIADYAFLSDCEVSGLVAPDGSVEWLCLPRPDSPSVFGALLDRSAGFFRFGPTGINVPNQRRYVPGTNVLETTWHTPTGWLIVSDLFVVGPAPTDERRERYRRVPADTMAQGTLLRIATCCSGRVEVQANCIPQFDYGRNAGEWTYDDAGYERVTCRSGDLALDLTGSMRLGILGPRTYGRTTLEHGESAWLALSWEGDSPTTEDEAMAQLAATEKYWRDWLALATIADHPWRQYLERSALALKGLSYAPTGAIMAAGTTSLPETPGGERNWDYRYTWIRDTAFMLQALHDLGFEWEAFEYFAFLLETLSANSKPGEWNMQIMYGIGGETDLSEHTLDHLSGYRNSRPVRVGNGAYDQHQHDVWGMLLDAVAVHQRRGGEIPAAVWEGICYFVDLAIERFPEPDQGIWEMRGDPQHFVASKVMCWVAADRGLRIARERDDDEHIERWQAAADSMRAEILDQGVDERGVFVQHYGTKDLDASALLIPIMGFLPGDDERVRATVLAIADELTQDGLVLRYRVATTDDGLSGEEGTFTICSFWLVSALTIVGEIDRARALFQKLLSFAGPLHLYAEEIDVHTGQHLGNFPQAFTHLALIDAGRRLIAVDMERESVLTPPRMQVFTTSPLEDPRDVREQYPRLEEIGYDGVFSFEAKHDPFVALAVAAEHTTRVQLGTAIAIAFARNPMTLAYLGNDLQLITGGRFLLGLGSQVRPHIVNRFSAPWSEPARRMREIVRALDAIWTSWDAGTPLTFEGDFYRHTLMIPAFDPGPNPFGRPPVYVGGFGPRMVEVAGEVADGLITHPFTTRQSLEMLTLPALERGLAAAGRTRADVQVVCATLIVTSARDDELERLKGVARQQLAFYGSTPAYAPTLECHGWGDLHPELNRLSKDGRWADMAGLIDDTMLEAVAVVGPPESIAGALRARLGGIADAVSLTNNRAPDPGHWADVVADLKRG